jgi:hypothetical protein
MVSFLKNERYKTELFECEKNRFFKKLKYRCTNKIIMEVLMKIWQGILLGVILLGVSCHKKAQDPSLIGLWTFDEGKGSVVRDVSGHGLDGNVVGGEWTEGKTGKALRFDGRSYIKVDHRPLLDSLTTELTVCAWIKRDTSRSWNTVVSREIANGWSETYGLAVFADTALFSIDPDGAHYSNVKDIATCPVGEWTLLAGTLRDSVYTLYVNGNRIRSGVSHIPIRYVDQNLLIIGGNTNTQGKEWVDLFHGIIDEVRIYRRALDDSEIRGLSLGK